MPVLERGAVRLNYAEAEQGPPLLVLPDNPSPNE